MTFSIWGCCSAQVEAAGEAREKQRTDMVRNLEALGAISESKMAKPELELESISGSVSAAGDDQAAWQVVYLDPVPLSPQQQTLFEVMAALRRRSAELLAEQNKQAKTLGVSNAER